MGFWGVVLGFLNILLSHISSAQDFVTILWIFMNYDILEKSPMAMGVDTRLNTAQVHTIEAIEKGYEKTVWQFPFTGVLPLWRATERAYGSRCQRRRFSAI